MKLQFTGPFEERSPDIQALADRLNRGWQLIDQAELAGDDAEMERLTAFWMELLQEYESLNDDLKVRAE